MPAGPRPRTGTGCGRRSCWLRLAAGPARDRRGPARQRGHGPQVAGPVRCPRAGRAQDLPRSGRPRRISALERAAVCALACQLPAATGVPLSRWTGPELAAELASAGPDPPDLAILCLADLGRAPHQALALPVVDLPARPGLRRQGHRDPRPVPGVLPGQTAAARRPVVSVDAKPSIQARARCHATGPPGRGRPVRVEHEYERGGALALLAALDVHTGKVFASAARQPPASPRS